jgi:hypothetical protein
MCMGGGCIEGVKYNFKGKKREELLKILLRGKEIEKMLEDTLRSDEKKKLRISIVLNEKENGIYSCDIYKCPADAEGDRENAIFLDDAKIIKKNNRYMITGTKRHYGEFGSFYYGYFYMSEDVFNNWRKDWTPESDCIVEKYTKGIFKKTNHYKIWGWAMKGIKIPFNIEIPNSLLTIKYHNEEQ